MSLWGQPRENIQVHVSCECAGENEGVHVPDQPLWTLALQRERSSSSPERISRSQAGLSMTLFGGIPHTSLQRERKQSTFLTLAFSLDTLNCHLVCIWCVPAATIILERSSIHCTLPQQCPGFLSVNCLAPGDYGISLQTSHGNEAENNRRHPALRRRPRRRSARRRWAYTHARARSGTFLLEVSRRLSLQRWEAFAQLPQSGKPLAQAQPI